MTETQRLEQRARDAVAECLIRRLTIPNIYFDVRWPRGAKEVDILAVDRAGSGDVHVIDVNHHLSAAVDSVPELLSVPSQFKWTAFYVDTLTAEAEKTLKDRLYAFKGMGRVGVITIARTGADDLGANVSVKAERFPGNFHREVTEFTASVEPDIQLDVTPSAAPPRDGFQIPQPRTLLDRLEEAESLNALGHTQAAFILAWAGVEAAMRLNAEREGLRQDRGSPMLLAKVLHSFGLLSEHDFRLLEDAFRLRNAAVHGYEVGTNCPYPVNDLVRIGKVLVSETAPAS